MFKARQKNVHRNMMKTKQGDQVWDKGERKWYEKYGVHC
jgi:hypothetical protein